MAKPTAMLGVGGAVLVVAYNLLSPTSAPPAPSTQSERTSRTQLDDRPYELRFKLADMLLREPPPTFASDEMRLRDVLNELPQGAPGRASLRADLAELVLESGFGSRQPDADVIEEGRELMEQSVAKLGSKSSRVLRLRALHLLAEGKAEEAIGLANEVQLTADGKQWEGEKKGHEQSYKMVRTPETDDEEVIWAAYHFQAQTLLAATCEKACRARKLEQLAAHAVEGAVFKQDPRKHVRSTC